MKNSIIRTFSRAVSGFYSRTQNSYVDELQRLRNREVNKLFSNFSVKNWRWLSSLNNALTDDHPKEKVKFTFILKTGEQIDAEGEVGNSVMEVAMDNHLDMEGACGGSLACTTCHLYVVDEKFEQVIPKPCDKEEDMLDSAPFQKPNSRLSCQIILTKEMEGVSFKLPLGTSNMAVDGHKATKH